MARTKRDTSPPPEVAQNRAGIYLRVSTEEQASSGYGLDVQRARCRAMAEAKGLELVAEYADEGISGTKGPEARPGLAALLHAVEGGALDVVIVLALDRLGRRTLLVLDVVERITGADVALVSCKESLDTSTPAGRFSLTLFAALAQLERDNIVERTTSGRNERGKRDGERGGRLPFGYRRRFVEAGVDVEPFESAVVRSIFAWRAEGLTLRAIAGRLDEQGYPPPRGAAQWYAMSVKVILDNEAAYRGGQRGESPERWPAILEVD